MLVCSRYLVTHLMGADLSNIVKTQKLTDDHVQFLVYQLLRGLKVSNHPQSDATALVSNLIELVELQMSVLYTLDDGNETKFVRPRPRQNILHHKIIITGQFKSRVADPHTHTQSIL